MFRDKTSGELDDKARIEKLCEKLLAASHKIERVPAIIQTRDETIRALCESVAWHNGHVFRLSIRLRSGEMKYKDVRDLYEDRSCYAYIESEPQVVFKFPENPEETPLGFLVDQNGFIDVSTDYEFFLDLP